MNEARVTELGDCWRDAFYATSDREIHCSDNSVIVLDKREEIVRQWRPSPGEVIALDSSERVILDSGYCTLIQKRQMSLGDFFRGR